MRDQWRGGGACITQGLGHRKGLAFYSNCKGKPLEDLGRK